MRIGIDASRAFRAPRTGTERYAWEILQGLIAHPHAPQDEWLLFVDLPPTGPDHTQLVQTAQARGVTLHWRYLPWRRLWTHRVLGPAVRAARVDALFVPSHVIPWTWPAHRNPPSVVTVHDVGYRYWPQAHPLGQRLYLELSTRWNLAAARWVICVSRATDQDVQRLYGARAVKRTVIHEAACPPPAHAQAGIAAARAAHGLPQAYAIFVGTLHPRKNIPRVIQAYARLQEAGRPALPLALVGAEGAQAQTFRAQVERLGLAQAIRFLGYVPEPQLHALLSGARMLVFPSLFEGFGLPVLEAQARGVPVMTSNFSSLPEVAGDAALFVDPTDVDAIADALLRLSQDEELRQRLIAAGYENVKRFSWERAAGETYAVLQAVAGGE